MRSLMLTSPAELVWQNVPEPVLTEKGALVRPIAVSTCDFDHLMAAGRTRLPMPIPIGHECVGEVLSVGEGVSRFISGDQVIVPMQISCGECTQCQAGHTSSCQAVRWLSGYGMGHVGGNYGGAMSDLISVPYADAMLIKLPSNIDIHHAPCLSCNISDAYRCVAPQLIDNPGAPVFIAGGAFNNIALYSVAIARVLGASQIDVFGIDKQDFDKVDRLGGNILTSTDQIQKNHYPITVDASQNIERLHLTIEASAPAGILTLSTMYPESLTSLPLMKMFEKCLTMTTGQPHIRALMEDAVGILGNNQDLFAIVTDAVLPWNDGVEAFGGGRGKQVLIKE